MSTLPTNRGAGSRATERSGFTLIEILVALGVVVVLLGVSVPVLLLSFGDRRLEAEAEVLAAQLSTFRASAAKDRVSRALELRPVEGWGDELRLTSLLADELAEQPSAGSQIGVFAREPLDSSLLYRASRPYRISAETPVLSEMDASTLGWAVDQDATGSSWAPPAGGERIRIAAVSASGQMLASRPIWLHNGERHIRIELNSATGFPVLGPMQLLRSDPDRDADGQATELDDSFDFEEDDL